MSLSLEHTVLEGEKFLKRSYFEAIVKLFFCPRLLSTLIWGEGGGVRQARQACVVVVLREAACEVICLDLSKHFWPRL